MKQKFYFLNLLIGFLCISSAYAQSPRWVDVRSESLFMYTGIIKSGHIFNIFDRDTATYIKAKESDTEGYWKCRIEFSNPIRLAATTYMGKTPTGWWQVDAANNSYDYMVGYNTYRPLFTTRRARPNRIDSVSFPSLVEGIKVVGISLGRGDSYRNIFAHEWQLYVVDGTNTLRTVNDTDIESVSLYQDLNSAFTDLTIAGEAGQNSLKVSFDASLSDEVEIIVRNEAGETLSSMKAIVSEGTNEFNLDINNTVSKLFIVTVKSEEAITTKKFLLD